VNYHLIGIAGTGMTALASLLKDLGYKVTGSDPNWEPPTASLLEEWRIPKISFKDTPYPEGVQVVVGNAIPSHDPEVVRAKEEKVLIWGLPHLLSHLVSYRNRIVVAGTHGKSTTTALLAYLLSFLGDDPGWFVGAVPRCGFPGRWGKGWFVMEGDEYDSAFFDRNPKFFHYFPMGLILTTVEMDHVDIYPSQGELEEVFVELVRLLPAGGVLVVNEFTERFSPKKGSIQVLNIQKERFQYKGLRGGRSVFSLRGKEWEFSLPGEHMARNCAQVLLLLSFLNYPVSLLEKPLKNFPGLKRRMEVLWEGEGVIYWDFAHHPTEVKAVLSTLREKHPGVPIFAVFEPRSYTSRTNRFLFQYREVFSLADRLFLAPVYRPEKLKEPPLDCATLASSHPGGFYTDSFQILRETVLHEIRSTPPPWVLVFFSNGSFQGLPERVKDEVARWERECR
jgi:UDP-N-acetylmuramate: L-alanyl-gamma-D-glutamyl-meso-diaminopimelate ligase